MEYLNETKAILNNEDKMRAAFKDAVQKYDEKRKQWELLKKGMKVFEVRNILGEPDKIESNDSSELWSYLDGGKITFIDSPLGLSLDHWMPHP